MLILVFNWQFSLNQRAEGLKGKSFSYSLGGIIQPESYMRFSWYRPFSSFWDIWSSQKNKAKKPCKNKYFLLPLNRQK